jgi:hypothetical protein
MESSMHSTFLPGRPSITALRHCALIGLICLTAAACGTQNGSGRPGQAAGPGQHSTPPGDSLCKTSHLDVTLDLRSAGVAAGTSLIPIDFTNVSTSSCRLTGFAYVSFSTDHEGRRVGPAATADRALAAHTLLLGAGKTAHLWLRMVAAADLPASQCRPMEVAGLQVRLPGQPASIFIAHRFTTCARRVRGTDILTVEPFQAGRAREGTAQ